MMTKEDNKNIESLAIFINKRQHCFLAQNGEQCKDCIKDDISCYAELKMQNEQLKAQIEQIKCCGNCTDKDIKPHYCKRTVSCTSCMRSNLCNCKDCVDKSKWRAE